MTMPLPKMAATLLLATTLLVPPARWAGAGTPPPPTLPAVPPGMTVTVTDKMTDIDADWPIIRKEQTTWIDGATQKAVTRTLIIRESPPFAQPTPCPNPSTTNISGCEEVMLRTSEEFSPLGELTLHVKHFAKKVCDGINCVWRKPHQLHVQWLRTDARWFVANAHVEWGCYGCATCSGGDWQEVWVSNPWPPTWLDDTTSSLYIFTDSRTPALLPYDGTAGRAGAVSEAYHNWNYQGQLVADAGFSP